MMKMVSFNNKQFCCRETVKPGCTECLFSLCRCRKAWDRMSIPLFCIYVHEKKGHLAQPCCESVATLLPTHLHINQLFQIIVIISVTEKFHSKIYLEYNIKLYIQQQFCEKAPSSGHTSGFNENFKNHTFMMHCIIKYIFGSWTRYGKANSNDMLAHLFAKLPPHRIAITLFNDKTKKKKKTFAIIKPFVFNETSH